jgi:hypothetical protein
MTFRHWYPQLDVYDAIRRMALLLANWEDKSISIERLSILDFYLASPPLLHDVHMPQSIRKEFLKLRVQKKSEEFLSYPAAPILFHKMEEIQKNALRTLAGKGLLETKQFHQGALLLTNTGKKAANDLFWPLCTETERRIVTFLTDHLGQIGSNDIRDIRNRTSLRRAS